MPEKRKKLTKHQQATASRKLSFMYAKEGKPSSESERKQRIAIAMSTARKGKH